MKKFALVALMLACSGVGNGLRVTTAQAAPQALTLKSAVMARGYDGTNPIGITNSFKSAKTKIHCVVVLNRTATVTAHGVWYALLPGGKELKIADANLPRQLADRIHFYLALKNPWPVGKYRVDVFVNNKKLRSLPFSVVK